MFMFSISESARIIDVAEVALKWTEFSKVKFQSYRQVSVMKDNMHATTVTRFIKTYNIE